MFDWMTWGIWAIGFAILVIWTIVPLREMKTIRKRLREKEKESQ